MVKLYHGTDYESAMNICMYGIDLTKSNKNLDFGSGFYTTPDYSTAEKRALLKARGRYEKAYIVSLEVDDTYWAKYNVKIFDESDINWGKFILYNRLGLKFLEQNGIKEHNLDNKYDIVIGDIADGKVSNIAYEVRNGETKINNVNFSDFLRDDGKSYGNQVSFHSKASLSCILSIKCDKIKIGKRKNKKGW